MPITIDTVPPVTTWANSFPVLCSIWYTNTLPGKHCQMKVGIYLGNDWSIKRIDLAETTTDKIGHHIHTSITTASAAIWDKVHCTLSWGSSRDKNTFYRALRIWCGCLSVVRSDWVYYSEGVTRKAFRRPLEALPTGIDRQIRALGHTNMRMEI